MNRTPLLVTALLMLFIAYPTRAQNILVSRENKTVSVTVTKSVDVQPEIGMVQVGYHNTGRTQSAVYEENATISRKIIEALLGAEVNKADIQTETLLLGRIDNSYQKLQPEREPQFEATQSWRVRVPVGQVQKVVDHAVAAGANDVGDVSWVVADPDALDAKARGLALAKARETAQEMAQSFGRKVGEVLYISNVEASRPEFMARGGGGEGMQTVEVSAVKLPLLNLFPQKVNREVTVYAVFALE